MISYLILFVFFYDIFKFLYVIPFILKISKTNFYLFFKNCSLFNFIFLSENREEGQTVLWI